MEKKLKCESRDYIYKLINGKWININTRIDLLYIFWYLNIKVPDLEYTTFARFRVKDTELEFRHYNQDKITITITNYNV